VKNYIIRDFRQIILGGFNEGECAGWVNAARLVKEENGYRILYGNLEEEANVKI
jgi:hypothetical protein